MRIFSVLLFLSTLVTAQNAKVDSVKVTDTPLNFSTYFNPIRFLPTSYFDNELNNLDLITPLPIDSASIFMQTRMQLARFNTQSPFDAKANLLNPLYKKYMAGQSNGLGNQILGAVEIGAVGFLAYKHISKYGFLKSKDEKSSKKK